MVNKTIQDSVSNMINILQGDVIGGAAVGVVDRDHGMIALSERQVVIGLCGSAYHQVSPALHRVAVRS